MQLLLYGVRKGNKMKEYIAFGLGMMLALGCIMLLENIESERNK